MARAARPLAVVTGASTGIGYELAKCCAESAFDLVVVADEKTIEPAAAELRRLGASYHIVGFAALSALGLRTIGCRRDSP